MKGSTNGCLRWLWGGIEGGRCEHRVAFVGSPVQCLFLPSPDKLFLKALRLMASAFSPHKFQLPSSRCDIGLGRPFKGLGGELELHRDV